jgi:transposase
MLPCARAAQLIADLYGLSVSSATLLGWVAEASAALLETAGGVSDQLRAAPVLHGDESGLRVAGKLHWLHVAATDNLTWYGVHGKRGLAAMQTQDILTRHEGVLVHDCWAPYWKLEGVTHALCNAPSVARVAIRERDHRPGLGATHEPFPARRQQAARHGQGARRGVLPR